MAYVINFWGIAADLEGKLAKASDATQAYDEAVAHDATLVIERLRAGLSGAWGAVGGKARRIGETLIASETDRRIAESALAAVRLEIERNPGGQGRGAGSGEGGGYRRHHRRVRSRPASGPSSPRPSKPHKSRSRGSKLFNMPPGTQSAEYRPVKRAAVIVTDAVSGDHELVIETREVAKSLSVIEAFKTALQHDPLAAAPSFPDLDLSIDPDLVYHKFARVRERRARDADPAFQPKIHTRPGTAV